MGRFLLISLNVDAILEGITIAERRKKLEGMRRGNGLSDAYTATLTRLRAQAETKSALGLKVIMWVLNSQRPLGVEELCHALGVEIGSVDFDPKNVPASRTLLSCCLGLVTVEASSRTFRLVHFTLQEHLASDPTIFNNLHNPHSIIAEICLTFLNSEYIRDISPEIHHTPPTIPFLDYASCFWGEHARREMTENVKVLALRLLDRFYEHISASQLLFRYSKSANKRWTVDEMEGKTKFTGLHGAAFLGVIEIFAAVLKMKEWDINTEDWFGNTALSWAAARGHEAVVKMLLERKDVNPDQADTKYGKTPLSWAAQNGHGEVVKMFLERKDVNPDRTDSEDGSTPLLLAAENGHALVAQMSLQREDINPDHVDSEGGWTPLSCAAQNGHEGVVKILLERKEVNPDQPDTKYGKTPLSWGAKNGHEGVVKILLEREDVNPDHADAAGGWTPLSYAAVNGHEGVVTILLERKEVNPDQPDTKYGKTPLSWAAQHGHEGVVKILLERKDVSPNHADTEGGWTPLSLAAGSGHVGVVKMLLERKEVNPDHADAEGGWTPLLCAAKNGHEGVVNMLLEREEVNPDRADTKYGKTPLSWAAQRGHEGVVKMFLERQDVNPDHADSEDGWTPLSLAAENGHDMVVKMLLERKNVNLDRPGAESGQTSPPSLTRLPEDTMVDMQFRSLDPNTDITNLNGQPRFPSPDSDEPEPVLDPQDSISMSLSNDPPVVEPSMLPKPSSLWPFKFLYPRRSDTHPNNTRPTLPIVVNRYSVIVSCVGLLAFFVSRKNSHNRTSPQVVGDAFARKVRHFFVFLCLKVGLWNWRRQNLRRFKSK